jgi:hypothetical protein
MILLSSGSGRRQTGWVGHDGGNAPVTVIGESACGSPAVSVYVIETLQSSALGAVAQLRAIAEALSFAGSGGAGGVPQESPPGVFST